MTDALQQAQEKLNVLLENARSGAIIPIRLPGQIEEIAALMGQAKDEHAAELKKAVESAAPADIAAYMKDEAYFVGHAVHEIRNPLTSVRGYTDMLGAMGELSDMQKQFMSTIKVNIRRMESLLADVGMMNKLRKNTLKGNPKMDMFKNLALRVEKDMSPVAKELNRQLTFDIPSGLPLLNIDGDLIVMVLNKLVENGLRYSSADNGQVTVSASADGDTLIILVEDNGIGIAPEDMEHLGETYFRSENDVVREYKGSGLGIPIVYGLMKFLGGTVEVNSEVDKGTKVRLTLPGMSA